MSVGFGFSAGDFIGAIELVGTVIDALRLSGSASTEFRELLSQLRSLGAALIRVKELEFEEEQYQEISALKCAATQCGHTIDTFFKKAQKYQPYLGSNSRQSIMGLKESWMKVKWAVCKKEDVAKFKADLRGHTESIQLLLMMVQMGKSTLHGKRQDEQHRSLAGRVQEGYFNCIKRLTAVADQGRQLLEMTTSVLQTNVKVFQMVLEIQQFMFRIPGQVERQQPVYLLDALGKTSPFHLEFVRSAVALVAVLKVNFEKHGNGAEKIERGEFAIQDSATKRDIDLKADWEMCFSPGQRVDMSMIIRSDARLLSLVKCGEGDCPKCGRHHPGREKEDDKDVECTNCGMTFRRIVHASRVADTDSGSTDNNIEEWTRPSEPGPSFHSPENSLKRKRSIDELGDFRRVRFYLQLRHRKGKDEYGRLYARGSRRPGRPPRDPQAFYTARSRFFREKLSELSEADAERFRELIERIQPSVKTGRKLIELSEAINKSARELSKPRAAEGYYRLPHQQIQGQ